jgi:hypothetical protein
MDEIKETRRDPQDLSSSQPLEYLDQVKEVLLKQLSLPLALVKEVIDYAILNFSFLYLGYSVESLDCWSLSLRSCPFTWWNFRNLWRSAGRGRARYADAKVADAKGVRSFLNSLEVQPFYGELQEMFLKAIAGMRGAISLWKPTGQLHSDGVVVQHLSPTRAGERDTDLKAILESVGTQLRESGVQFMSQETRTEIKEPGSMFHSWTTGDFQDCSAWIETRLFEAPL